jgi:hypothetical protein
LIQCLLVSRRTGRSVSAALGLSLTACAWSGSGPGCRPLQQAVALPEGLEESSGVAVSRAHPGVFWTHADGGRPTLFAVDSAGSLLSTVTVEGADLTDWEDVALAECGDGDCLYLADAGDNQEERETLRILRLREPTPGSNASARPDVFRVRLPDGPRDIEAIFVLPGERVHLVSKGRNHAVTVYRYDGTLRGDSVVSLSAVQQLSEGPRALPRQVTGAAASADGEIVAIRTYESLLLYRVTEDSLASLSEGTVNLRTLGEGQGEGVGVGEEGIVALSSESGPARERGSLALLRCEWK